MAKNSGNEKTRRKFLEAIARGAAGLAVLYVLAPGLAAAHGSSKTLGGRIKSKKYLSLFKELEESHGFSKKEIDGIFKKVRLHDAIPKLFAKPAEDLPYTKYKPLVISEQVIDQGRIFLAENKSLFDQAESEYGVDRHVIGAILGIETKYGARASGGYTVLDALNTIFSDVPNRQSFGRKELIEFLLLCREENMDPHELEGSYAGAMGMPQFIPSSYRMYAVDFDGDGKRDLWKSKPDIIGSGAHYLKRHGWEKDGPIMIRVTTSPQEPFVRRFLTKGLSKKSTYRILVDGGVEFVPVEKTPPDDAMVSMISYQAENTEAATAAFSNFRTVLKYN
ncbi:MAG TPA: lytic murein transglycosylase, partial [Nitrospiria bacterium]|nr:lytic murein transglycosylase [Nitrospiria bacterium]